jgi:hypothetical protein
VVQLNMKLWLKQGPSIPRGAGPHVSGGTQNIQNTGFYRGFFQTEYRSSAKEYILVPL